MPVCLRNPLILSSTCLSLVAASSPRILRSQAEWQRGHAALEVAASGRLKFVSGVNQSGVEGLQSKKDAIVSEAGNVDISSVNSGQRSRSEWYSWRRRRSKDTVVGKATLISTRQGSCLQRCHNKGGLCRACGKNKACCRTGHSGPWQCNGGGCSGYHCCTTARRNCMWGQWGPWSSCRGTSGVGTRSRERGVSLAATNGGRSCKGESLETARCSQEEAPAGALVALVGGPCPCATGAQRAQAPVNCIFNTWETWGACSATCGGGQRERRRSEQAAQGGGQPCLGKHFEVESCGTKGCPVDCQYMPWESWGPCSRSCGGGIQKRTRVKEPELHGGRACVGPASQTESCKQQQCPVGCTFQDWDDWSICSEPCGFGKRTRRRAVVEGQSCAELSQEKGRCDAAPECAALGWNVSNDSTTAANPNTTRPQKSGSRGLPGMSTNKGIAFLVCCLLASTA